MKPLASYFGNRFAAVPAKKSKTARKAASEMEALESRLLLSGIVADGSKSYKKLTYTDLEGDKVTISVTKGSFTILGTNGDSGNELFTVDKITLDSLASTSTLNIKVANIKASGNGDAFTEIGEITSAKTAMKSITLDGANVANINLGDTSLSGGIVLKATAANIIDRDNSAGTMKAIANVNLNNVSVQSVATIQAATQGYGVGQGLNFNGAITVDAGTTSIIGRTSDVNGALNLAVAGNINVGGFGTAAQVNTSGDLTLVVADGQSLGAATFNVGGNLHLGVLSGGLGAAGVGPDFNVTGSISGANAASTTDVVSINGVIATGTNFNTNSSFAGISVAGGDATFGISTVSATKVASIGDITVSQGALNLTFGASVTGAIGNITAADAINFTGAVSATSVGNISGDAVLTGAFTASTGNIGNITATAGSISTDFTATLGNIGNVSASVDVQGDVIASAGNIGNITATAGDILGLLTASKGNIGNLTAGDDISGAITLTLGSVGNITADTLSVAVTANNSIGNITIDDGITTAITAGNATVGSTTAGGIGNISVNGEITAAILTNTGSIGNITSTAGGTSAAGTITSAGSIGNISVTGTTQGINANIIATAGNIGNVTASVTTGLVSGAISADITASKGTIGNITATATTTTGISGDAFDAGVTITSLTSIGNVTGTVTGLGGDGAVGALTIVSKTIGDVSLTGTATTVGGTNAVGAGGTLTLGTTTASTGTGTIGNISVTGLTGTIQLNGRESGGGFSGATVGNITLVQQGAGQNTQIEVENIYQIGNVSTTAPAIVAGTTTLDIEDTNNSSTVYLQSVGNITAADKLNFFNAGNTSLIATIGNISAGDDITMKGGNALTTIGTLTSGGDVSLAGLTDSKLISLGNVSVSGVLSLGDNTLAKVTTLGTFTVDQLGSADAAVTIGDGTASNAVIGYITIGEVTDATGGDSTFTFDFDSYNGVTTSTAEVVGKVDTNNTAINVTTASMPRTETALVFQLA